MLIIIKNLLVVMLLDIIYKNTQNSIDKILDIEIWVKKEIQKKEKANRALIETTHNNTLKTKYTKQLLTIKIITSLIWNFLHSAQWQQHLWWWKNYHNFSLLGLISEPGF